MHFGYLLREGISSVRRTPVASAVTLVTIVAALTLMGLFAYGSMNFDNLLSTMRQRVELEAFLLPTTPQQTEMLQAQIVGVSGVDSVHYVSQQEAAQLFERQTGENVTALLDTNPLPASFRIALRHGNADAQHAAQIAREIQDLGGVDTVLYRQEFVSELDSIASTTRSIVLIGGIIIILIAILLTANTIRLAIYSKRNVVQTLHLVGATMTFIRIPFLLEGTLHGALAALISIGLLAGFIQLLLSRFFVLPLLSPPVWFYAGIAALGILLGFFGSVIAVMRFLNLAQKR